jgi:hypothetical protein
MGYNVRFEKPLIAGQEPDRFTPSEWQAFQSSHPHLDYAYFAGNSITCKNPSEHQLKELAKVAYQQGWRLRGDDGEYYDEDANAITPTAPQRGFFSMVKNAFADARAARQLEKDMRHVESSLSVGDKVKFLYRTGGVVIAVNKQGNSGLGEIRVRFPDGAILTGMFPDGGFEKDE